MPRGVERGQLVTERQAVAVLLDDVADVVALERDRPLGERPATVLQLENVAASLYTAIASWKPVIMYTPRCGSRHTGPCSRT